MNVLIAGSGKTLFFLCRAFTAKGHAVTLVNTNRDECEQLARELPALVIHGDASEADVLKEAGAMRADVILAITPKDQDNLVICQLAALQFGAPRTLALANDPDNAPIFEQLGVHAFSTTEIISSLIEQRASLEQVLTQLTIGQGRVNVTDLVAPPVGTAYFDQATLLANSGETSTYNFGVLDSSKPLKVTLAWSDAPGAPGFTLDLIRWRGGPAGARWQMEWNRDEQVFRGAALSGALLPVAPGRTAVPRRAAA